MRVSAQAQRQFLEALLPSLSSTQQSRGLTTRCDSPDSVGHSCTQCQVCCPPAACTHLLTNRHIHDVQVPPAQSVASRVMLMMWAFVLLLFWGLYAGNTAALVSALPLAPLRSLT